jgi:hypothetical protein
VATSRKFLAVRSFLEECFGEYIIELNPDKYIVVEPPLGISADRGKRITFHFNHPEMTGGRECHSRMSTVKGMEQPNEIPQGGRKAQEQCL